MPSEDKTTVALSRTIQIMTVVLLCVACILMVHLTILANRITRTLEANAENVAKITATAARVSEKIDKIEMRAERWLRVTRADEVISTLDAVARIGEGFIRGSTGPDPNVKSEIAHLLSRIRGSPLAFEYGGNRYSAARFYYQILAKHKAHERTLASAEDFIANVATSTITGKTYHVVAADGSKRELAEWLAERLREHRAGRE